MSKQILEKILKKFPSDIVSSHSMFGNETVEIKKESFYKLIEFLKDSRQFEIDMLVDITCVDYPYQSNRFMMVYHLYSTTLKHRVRVKTALLEENPTIESIVPLWESANWLEREVFDMFGVIFKNHPNLKRILLYDSFKGYPLRKDYPITQRQPIVGPLN